MKRLNGRFSTCSPPKKKAGKYVEGLKIPRKCNCSFWYSNKQRSKIDQKSLANFYLGLYKVPLKRWKACKFHGKWMCSLNSTFSSWYPTIHTSYTSNWSNCTVCLYLEVGQCWSSEHQVHDGLKWSCLLGGPHVEYDSVNHSVVIFGLQAGLRQHLVATQPV